jgi:hypothetical protein
MFKPASIFLALVLALSLAATSAAHAADYKGLYEGTIGTARVVVDLGDPAGCYFYETKGVDIFLRVAAKAGAINVVEKAGEDDEKAAPTGRWTLTPKGDTLTGTWNAPKGTRTLPIALTRGAAPEATHDSTEPGAAPAAYKQKWLGARLHWALGPEITVGDLAYAEAKDSIYGTRMPRLVRFADSARKAKINAALETLQMQRIFEIREASLFVRQSAAVRDGKSVNAIAETNPDDQTELRVTELAPGALSFVIGGILDSGGAHPNTYVTPYTIDLTKAKPVQGTQINRSEEAASTPIFDGALDLGAKAKRQAFETLWVAKLRASLPPANPKSDKTDEDADAECSEQVRSEEFLDLGGATYALYLAKGGLAVHPMGWPNVAAYCFSAFKPIPVVLTATELQPFLAPGHSLIGVK